jgi:hypothetical protein
MKACYIVSVVALQALFPTGHNSGLGELRSAPLPPPSYMERDSTFDPDGPWEAVQWIRLGDLEISGFVLVTHDCPGLGACTPRSEPRAWVNAGRVDAANVTPADCPHALVRPDTLALRCPRTPLGDVRLDGTFVDSTHSGLPDSLFRNRMPGAMIARVRVQVVRSGQVVYSAVHEFIQAEGD